MKAADVLARLSEIPTPTLSRDERTEVRSLRKQARTVLAKEAFDAYHAKPNRKQRRAAKKGGAR